MGKYVDITCKSESSVHYTTIQSYINRTWKRCCMYTTHIYSAVRYTHLLRRSFSTNNKNLIYMEVIILYPIVHVYIFVCTVCTKYVTKDYIPYEVFQVSKGSWQARTIPECQSKYLP